MTKNSEIEKEEAKKKFNFRPINSVEYNVKIRDDNHVFLEWTRRKKNI